MSLIPNLAGSRPPTGVTSWKTSFKCQDTDAHSENTHTLRECKRASMCVPACAGLAYFSLSNTAHIRAHIASCELLLSCNKLCLSKFAPWICVMCRSQGLALSSLSVFHSGHCEAAISPVHAKSRTLCFWHHWRHLLCGGLRWILVSGKHSQDIHISDDKLQLITILGASHTKLQVVCRSLGWMHISSPSHQTTGWSKIRTHVCSPSCCMLESVACLSLTVSVCLTSQK